MFQVNFMCNLLFSSSFTSFQLCKKTGKTVLLMSLEKFRVRLPRMPFLMLCILGNAQFTNSMCHFFPLLGNPTKTVPTWILACGGIAIDIGLLTYGYKVMATLGNNITYMSPSRSFSVSLGTSPTVLTCSKLGLPVSTTHCITGATTAVGLCSGGGRKVEYGYASSYCRPART